MQKKKTCCMCKEELELTEFSGNKKRSDKLQSQCKKCHNLYSKIHYKKNKEKYIKEAKIRKTAYKDEFLEFLKTQECKDCGNKDYRVFEFDHLENKKFNIGARIGGQTLKSLMKEISKCDVVCANCHRIRTISRGNWYRNK
jgi:hypothetical protein